jgi:hypothetical protein
MLLVVMIVSCSSRAAAAGTAAAAAATSSASRCRVVAHAIAGCIVEVATSGADRLWTRHSKLLGRCKPWKSRLTVGFQSYCK